MNHPAVQTSSGHFNVVASRAWRKPVFLLLAVTALGVSALGGAWAHVRFFSAPALLPQHEQALISHASRNSAYIRENIGMLAQKVGALQAKVAAVDGLTQRVAQAAGVHYTEPELVANLPVDVPGPDVNASMPPTPRHAAAPGVMDDVTGVAIDHFPALPAARGGAEVSDSYALTAEGLGRQLDVLHAKLISQQDSLALLDLMLTRRTGVDASLPSVVPVADVTPSSSFGWRRHPITRRHSMHEGMDFAAPRGTPIYAAAAGVVTQARFRSGYGNLVEIVHGNGLSTRYAHASKLNVTEGELVDQGQLIALVGSTGRSTGPHLHFEVRMAGHPLDPALFLPPTWQSGPLVADAGEHAVTNATQVR